MTSVFEARRRIVALLTDRPALADVKITRGGPTKATEARPEMIFLGDVLDEHDSEMRVLGANRRDEDYDLTLTVYVFRSGDDEEGSEARLEELCDEVATALQEDLTLDGLLRQAIDVSRFEQRTTPTLEPEGWEARATVHLRCQTLNFA